MPKIVVVDDDPNIRELIGLFLKRDGHQVVEAGDGIEALEKLKSVKPDLAIIDIMMPRMDGWALCSELSGIYDIPLLLLTAKGETIHKVKGLELGADDYLVKPFDPPELQARVKALLRRYRITASQNIELGSISMNYADFRICCGEETLSLPPKEFELLFRLASYPGKTFSREDLITQLWGVDYEGDERTVDVHIKRLRTRFPEGSFGFRIETVRGLGYRLESTAG
ncbi:DNA-binding response regulator [Paenibacillus sp. MY03]|jgi:two-component system OmpR family response regulator|uniref:response regulator transcription factor n=1 Tax=Paenibacillus sp. MY03 TaxID=302980 RepID=UPI000B3D011E|nr:response regulator transcription factor [Paenibacillus sp. MY03]OUS75186.1 DNA-binding response regulator [Paenibacillus sp. MY03]